MPAGKAGSRDRNAGCAMILGLGIDVVANVRVSRELARGEWRVSDGIFTRREVQRCEGAARPAFSYAACFAAKEATLKALGMNLADLGMMLEVEIEPDSSGRTAVILHGRMKSESEHMGVRHIRLSTVSTKRQTGAMVILES